MPLTLLSEVNTNVRHEPLEVIVPGEVIPVKEPIKGEVALEPS